MLICVTNRRLCRDDFLHRLERLAAARPYAVMLREKDLDLPEYERLARKAKEICDRYGILLIISQNTPVAEKAGLTHLHFPMTSLRTYKNKGNLVVGASVHTLAEAEEAKALGAAYIVAGHIFATDSKKGLPPRGLPFLRQVCEAVDLPVFAIGGIDENNAREVMASGAAGFCVMSAAMTCRDPAAFVKKLSF